ncbi:MAG: LysR family transcriptional regulator [Candidatus Muproteobacteria bacterium RBG_16_65_34]|uniref:LysR family transcriptional regulator n=1 Tax=Candidatus Muproteobacteria bacterium RBG_16_65_34 TaxID=1817760 RepID=A0A1F6TR89_9PROT|nr:MAG: LysR family transcriptional regulator [Candidatus Muproteobacteria bacterium RBG_16_65_34]
MTLTELRYIVAVARERHFGRAAKACFVSQPTLSAAVKKLEEELGAALFERTPGRLRVTAVGQRVVEQAQRVLEQAAAIKELARAGHDELAGPLKVGFLSTVGPYLLPDLIPVLRRRAPKMPLVVEEHMTETLRARLKEGTLDAVVASAPFVEPGIVTLALYEEPFALVLPAGHALARKARLTVDELRRENLLLLGPGHCFRDQVLSVCPVCESPADDEHSIQRTLEGSSLETIRHMVASGVGITLLPCTAVASPRHERRLLTARRFPGAQPTRRIALAWRASFPRPKAIAALRAAILDCPLKCVRRLHRAAADAAA